MVIKKPKVFEKKNFTPAPAHKGTIYKWRGKENS